MRSVLDEVFGAENFVSMITVHEDRQGDRPIYLPATADFILWYARIEIV